MAKNYYHIKFSINPKSKILYIFKEVYVTAR